MCDLTKHCRKSEICLDRSVIWLYYRANCRLSRPPVNFDLGWRYVLVFSSLLPPELWFTFLYPPPPVRLVGLFPLDAWDTEQIIKDKQHTLSTVKEKILNKKDTQIYGRRNFESKRQSYLRQIHGADIEDSLQMMTVIGSHISLVSFFRWHV